MEEDDEDFLSVLDAVEADLMKRRKVIQCAGDDGGTSSSSSSASLYPNNNETPTPNPNVEGKYTAALRGSNSHLWQAYGNPKTSDNINNRPRPESYGGGGGGSTGICYKCQQPGHWAKDCGLNSGGGDERVAEKQCPCGAGPCSVLTSNTDRNPGRKFYRCPLREDSGGCKFFEWCDAAAAAAAAVAGYGGQPMCSNTEIARGSQPDSMRMQMQMQCPCGAGPCSLLISKTHTNMDRQFFKCPLKQGNGSCNFFKWCDEVIPTSNNLPVVVQSFSLKYDSTTGNSEKTRYDNTPGNPGRTGPSPCYKCGIDGHWARDCLKSSSSMAGPSRTGQGDRSTCFKCGQAGHWAKDCLFQSSNSIYGGREFLNSPYKCGGIGFQASSLRKS